eukprot:14027006-Alexandrium_andersonii.AAC.1
MWLRACVSARTASLQLRARARVSGERACTSVSARAAGLQLFQLLRGVATLRADVSEQGKAWVSTRGCCKHLACAPQWAR